MSYLIMQLFGVYTVVLMAASIFEIGCQSFCRPSNNTATVSGTDSLRLQACLNGGNLLRNT